jgi:hypothetical protein
MFNKALKEEIRLLKFQLELQKAKIKSLEWSNRRNEPRGDAAIKQLPDDLKQRMDTIYKKWKNGGLCSRSEKQELSRYGIVPEFYAM